MYFESHAHYNSEHYDEDRDEVLESFRNSNISHIVNIGTSIETSLESIKLAEKYDFVYASVGVHPHYTKDVKDEDYTKLENLCSHKKVVAFGEIGLDFHYDFSPRDVQIDVFKKQLKICENVKKPVIIHSREASQLVFDIIKESNVRRGIIHAYSGSVEMAKEYIKMGFLISIGGVVTFKNAKTLVDVVQNIDLEHIVIETDAPYLTPVPFRGKRNSSHYLKYVVEKIAEIKKISTTEVEKVTFLNCESLFF